MVQVRDNLTELEGEVRRLQPDPRRPDYDTVVVRVSRAAPVEGKADLVHAGSGDEIPVAVRRALLGGVGVGTQIRLRAARTSSGDVMAEPHPEPGRFRII